MILSPKADSYELTYSAWQKAMSEQHDKKKHRTGEEGEKNHNSALYLNDNHRVEFSLMATRFFFMFKFNDWIKMNIRMWINEVSIWTFLYNSLKY